jgi:cell division septal protein FtsQ
MIGTRNRRERRQRNSYTGVLRDARVMTPAEGYVVDHSAPRRRPFSWRWISLMIVIVLTLVLVFFYTSSVFYVRSISVGGVRYLTKEEIFAYADIANMHIFWVDPARVRENLLRSSSIADAQVWIGWPPQMVNIVVEEREPALVWEQSGTAIWVDIQGRIMAQRQDRPDLTVIQADMAVADGPLGESGRVRQEIVLGALQLEELLPGTQVLRYDSARGLGYAHEGGWQVWLGTGTGMPEKIAIVNAMTQSLQARGIQPGEINVVDPDFPFYTVMWGR